MFLSISLFSCDIGGKQIQIVELGNFKKVYIKDVSWGMTGDNSRYYIGSSKKIEDTINEPFYVNDFFYKLENDTFYVYNTSTANRIEKWDKKVHLKEVILSNSEMTDLCLDYKKHNLKSIIWD